MLNDTLLICRLKNNSNHPRMFPSNASLPVLRSRAFVESIENPFYPRGDMAAYNITTRF